MKLAKYMLPSGQTGVGRIKEDGLLPLDFAKGHYRSLFEILEADNPHEAAEFITHDSQRIPLSRAKRVVSIVVGALLS